jgi:hypothetical protein
LIRVSDPDTGTDHRMSSRRYLLRDTRLFHGLFPLRPTYRSLATLQSPQRPLEAHGVAPRQRFSGSVAEHISTSGHVHFRPCQYAHHASARLSLLGVTTCGHRHHPDDCKYSFRETCVQGLRSRWGGKDSETVMPVWITPWRKSGNRGGRARCSVHGSRTMCRGIRTPKKLATLTVGDTFT